MARGGARPGAGRKPKPKVLTAQFGPSGVAPAPVIPTTNELPPIEEFDAPDSLTFEERQVWMKQAGHAFQNRTLTKATAMAFERYCRMVVRERIESLSSAAEGPNHRGLRREINTLELQFGLTANGKGIAMVPAAQASQPESKLGRFVR